MGRIFFACVFAALVYQKTNAQVERPFFNGEKVTYEIVYNWGFIWVPAGEVSFSVSPGFILGKKALKITGTGTTYPQYDWMYKVRDTYEAYVDSSNLRPIKFYRDVQEGKFYINESYLFNHQKNLAYSFINYPNKPLQKDTIVFPAKTYDVLTMIYVAREMDFSGYQPNTQIPIKIIIDNAVYDSYIRYLGIETLTYKGLKPVKCFKFKPLLIDGTIFNAGEDMTVYVSADENRIPLLIETPILVGKIKAVVKSTQGLKKPISYLE